MHPSSLGAGREGQQTSMVGWGDIIGAEIEPKTQAWGFVLSLRTSPF